ncbi:MULTISPECIES: prefoldin subunit alpha [Acidiplasma]|jgi:prefoldin alpha subunit|uniref:Prefoldin subunit alpha n=2 Tax=Acidiplasma TaxID=507753 RepID=A0A0Q0RY37_9ARCH|nr:MULTISPECIES: prefoldin subunit alpha [Acidiplasma]KJE49918.1 prefoldin subunit alpha [Acidiplasma sp. MBA-1]KPV45997.1 prefoldin subunit alpha [Acidiplasma aeolicum]KQB34978.1 prefoldin subunit alpha [Acidiplasma cupricumulans]KQB35574.1 prefoldin subunit alpha [Acidiplasma aeolicum]WMT55104.1 MAG: prefoldin subunit alpha [Acidiplasma sp.]
MADQENVLDQLEYLKNLIENINGRIEIIAKTLQETSETASLLENNEYQKSEDVKISIGSGLFARATLNTDKILVPVGSNVYIEKDRADALEDLKANIKNLNDSYNSLIEQKEKVQNNYDALVYAIQNARGSN